MRRSPKPPMYVKESQGSMQKPEPVMGRTASIGLEGDLEKRGCVEPVSPGGFLGGDVLTLRRRDSPSLAQTRRCRVVGVTHQLYLRLGVSKMSVGHDPFSPHPATIWCRCGW